MQLSDNFTLPFPRERVWQAFQDVEQLVGCLPGATLANPPAGGVLEVRFSVKLGPMLAQFAGKGEVAFDAGQYRGRFAGTGADRRTNSRVKGEATFVMEAIAADATRVDLTVDYALTGALAQFSRGSVVKELASLLTQQFSQCLAARLAAASAAVASQGAQLAAAAPPPPVDGFRLLLRALWNRLRAMLGRGATRS